jgi:imidazoleglycerol phosphate dehydratase HisB
MEDIGLVIGRALLEIMKVRMERYGVQGAGSTIASESDLLERNIQVGVSVEGRKFWRFIPRDGDYTSLRREFLIGQNCCGGLRSEDLDDFVDGLAGGMSASIMIQVGDYNDPDATWREVFSGLGAAIKEAFTLNPFRKGVPPGVKATLG